MYIARTGSNVAVSMLCWILNFAVKVNVSISSRDAISIVLGAEVWQCMLL